MRSRGLPPRLLHRDTICYKHQEENWLHQPQEEEVHLHEEAKDEVIPSILLHLDYLVKAPEDRLMEAIREEMKAKLRQWAKPTPKPDLPPRVHLQKASKSKQSEADTGVVFHECGIGHFYFEWCGCLCR